MHEETMMSSMTVATLVLFPAMMAYAAASDLVTMRLSNRLTLALVVGFAVFALLCGLSAQTIAWHLGGGALVLVVTFGMFAAGWIGGGDAKLAAATALWLGPELLFTYVAISSFLGGMLTLGLLSMRNNPLPSFAVGWTWLERLHGPKTGIPYGIALAAAALLIFPESAIWRAAIL
jgi:prepilin peptidase CpaA